MQEFFNKEVENIIKSDKNLRSFSRVTGVNASVYRYGSTQDFKDHKEILSKISVTSCNQFNMASSAFCNVVHSCADGQNRCGAFREKASLQCISLGESYITRCHAGLTICLAPLVAGERCIGAITCGPVIMWAYDDFAKAETRALAEELKIDPEKLVQAGSQLVQKTSEEVGALADMLQRLAEAMAIGSPGVLDKNRQINVQQARIAELLHKKKQTEARIAMMEDTEATSHYPLNKEKELIGLVKVGDRKAAKALLNEILVDVFYFGAGKMDVLKARVLELVVVISRAAVESGAGLERMLGINLAMVSQFAEIEEFDKLCLWVAATLDEMMDTIYQTRNVKNSAMLSKAMEYIRENFASEISLEDVAKHAVVSESHISHLFGKELGITFSGYLTKVRIEKAKQLLTNHDYSVATVAEMVGYDQAGYFSKVFKKHVEITPGKFRRGDET